MELYLNLKFRMIPQLDKIKNINCGILEPSDTLMTNILLFGENLCASPNTLILTFNKQPSPQNVRYRRYRAKCRYYN